MRIFEIIALILVTTTIFSSILDRTNRTFLHLLFTSSLGLMLQHWKEGIRWQLYPSIYLLLFVYVCYKFWPNRQNHVSYKGIVLVWLLLGWFTPWSVPVFEMPEPGGEFTVGTQTFYLTDSSRIEWFTPDETDDFREMVLQCWYPSKDSKSQAPEPYMDQMRIRAKPLSNAAGISSFLPTHLEHVKTNSYENLSCYASNGPYPTLIFSHGITGSRHLHQILFEYLSSRGFIVFAPNHSYDASISIFPDGRIADYRSEITGHPDSVAIRSIQMETRSEDIKYIQNFIVRMNNGDLPSKLKGMIDLNKLALAGHSFGGATAICASSENKMIKACIALDGWISPIPNTIINSGMNVPFLFIGRKSWNDSSYPGNYLKLAELINSSSGPCNIKALDQALHLDFSDVPMHSPLIRYFVDVGTLKQSESIQLTNQAVHGFLEENLLKIKNENFRTVMDNKLFLDIF